MSHARVDSVSGSEQQDDGLAAWILEGCARFPDALLIEYGHDGEPQQIQANQLLRRALEWTSAIRAIEPDYPLLLCFERLADFIPACWAAIFCGRWVIPWQFEAGMLARPVAKIRQKALHECFPRAVLLHGQREGPAVSELLAATVGWRALSEPQIPTAPGLSGMPDISLGGGRFLATGGSSGKSKFARISNTTLSARAALISQGRPARGGELMCFPFDGITGGAGIMPWQEPRVVLPAGRLLQRPDEALEIISKYKIQDLPISPTLLAALVAAMESSQQPCDLSGTSHFRLGSEPISAFLIKRFIRQCPRFGIAKPSFSMGYGMTETGIISYITLPDVPATLRHLADGRAPPGLGAAAPGTTLRILDEQGQPVEDGVEGHIQVMSPRRLFDGYQTVNGLDRSSFTDDGWFRTGDRGWLDAGQLTVTGRASGSMRLAGRTVSLEAIEMRLGSNPELLPGALAAVPIRYPGSLIDELGLFFSIGSQRSADARAVARKLRQGVLLELGTVPRHLVCVPESEFPRTASYKVVRSQLVEGYLAGKWPAVDLDDARMRPADGAGVEERLRLIWAQTLGIGPDFEASQSFFDLGADSLHVAVMVIEAEAQFRRRIPLEAFFKQPTLATLLHHLQAAGVKQQVDNAHEPPEQLGLMRSLESALRSWSGHRASPAQLAPSINSTGHKPPIFWVFQNEREFESLGAALGSDQPLYGLRSLVGLVLVRDYDRASLDVACDLYWPLVEAQQPEGPLILGGNCQGAIVALALARRLRRFRRAVQPLILMEWSFSFGAYDGPVALLYGDQSFTARYYAGNEDEGPRWRDDFPSRVVVPIQGGHGKFFTPENVPVLATKIARIVKR